MKIRLKVSITCLALLIIVVIALSHKHKQSGNQSQFRETKLTTKVEAPSLRVPNLPVGRQTLTGVPVGDLPITGLASVIKNDSHLPTHQETPLKSFTPIPESLRRLEVVLAISNCVALNSKAVHLTLVARSEPYDPPPIGDGISDPTDEQIDARSDYDLAYNQRKLQKQQEWRVLKGEADSSYKDALSARSKLPEILGSAYADYLEWQMAEKIAAILSWDLSKEITIEAAQRISHLWSEGHSAVLVFDSTPEVNLIGNESRDLLFVELNKNR